VCVGTATLAAIYGVVTALERRFLAPGEHWMVLDMRELPSLFDAARQLAIIVLAEEVLFYHSHRLLHHPALYRRFHKNHHEWTAPVGLASVYCHPLEHVLSNAGPAMIATLAARAHVVVFYAFSFLAVVNTTVVHAGYHFPFVYPSPEHHDFHHETFNSNFGVTGLCDYIYGTDAKFKESGRSLLHGVTLTMSPLPRSKSALPRHERQKFFGLRALS